MSIIEKAVSRLDAKVAEQAAEAHQSVKPHQDVQVGTPDSPASMPFSLRGQTELPHPAHTRPAAAATAAGAATPGLHAVVRDDPIRHHVDLDNLQRLGMVMPNGARTPISEEFRAIKRPLISQAFARGSGVVRHSNLIMVTSAMPREGKTFCAVNLALSIAMEMDHTVLLVDADVARPSVLGLLGLSAEVGLLDVLQDKHLDLGDVMMRTDIDSLSILPAGRAQRNATELLASQSMTAVLDEIASRYPDRIVIFDSPPLLLTTEARALAAQMGQIVVVVEAEVTTQQSVKNALRQLDGCRNVNLVYNKSTAFMGGDKYGDYYK